MATTFERVRDIIVDQLSVDPDEVTMEAKFRDDLDADSLDLVELIMAFEEEFGGDISDEEAQKILSVGDAVRFMDGELLDSDDSSHDKGNKKSDHEKKHK